MGKKAPTPPPAPDPTVVIGAQTASNDQTAQLQSQLNNGNSVGPTGSVTNTLNPSTNQWTQTTSLSPAEQQIFDAQTQDQGQALGIAGGQLDNVAKALQAGNLSAPTLQSSASGGPIQTGYGDGGQLAYGYNPGGAIQTQVAPTYSPFGGLGMGTGGAYQPAQAPAAAAQGSDPTYGGFLHHDDSSGWIPTVNDGTDPTGAHPGEMYDFSSGWVPATSAAVNPTQPQAQPGPQPGASGQAQASPGAQSGAFGSSPSSLASILSNPVLGTQAATYAQATQMLDPQWQQATEQQQAQLVAQGLNPNDAAYQNSMQLFGNQENNAYNEALYGAINAGDAEQNTLYGQNLNSAEYGLSAQGQQYGENQGEAQFNNETVGQANAQNAGAAAFANTAENQYYGQQLSNAQLANQTAQQDWQDTAYDQELPINEFNSLMSSGQVSAPQTAQLSQTGIAAPDVTGAYALQSQALQNTYDAQEQNYQSGLGGLFNLGSSLISAAPKLLTMSDARLKRDITRIGQRPDGIGVYAFRYRAHAGWHVGVIAQEVARVRPDAVREHHGYLAVDYGRLAAA